MTTPTHKSGYPELAEILGAMRMAANYVGGEGTQEECDEFNEAIAKVQALADRSSRLNGAGGAEFAALKRILGPSDDPNFGWRGNAKTSNEHFACEFCGAEHLDCFLIEHGPACPVPAARKAMPWLYGEQAGSGPVGDLPGMEGTRQALGALSIRHAAAQASPIAWPKLPNYTDKIDAAPLLPAPAQPDDLQPEREFLRELIAEVHRDQLPTNRLQNIAARAELRLRKLP
jgi:hypothetical protein